MWEIYDSSSEFSQGRHKPQEGVSFQSANVSSLCDLSQANEQQDASLAEGTEPASVMTEPADISACPSGLSRHCNNIQGNNKMAGR